MSCRVLALLLLFAGAHSAHSESKWHLLGSDGEFHFHLDQGAIVNTQYPSNYGGPLHPKPKPYKETWIAAIDTQGAVIAQFLWAFDCAGRAAQLATVVSSKQDIRYKSHDYTVNAERIGAEQYLTRISPGSMYETIQTIICKTR